jgi:hypothetical protein
MKTYGSNGRITVGKVDIEELSEMGFQLWGNMFDREVYRFKNQELLRDPVDGGFVQYNLEVNSKP